MGIGVLPLLFAEAANRLGSLRSHPEDSDRPPAAVFWVGQRPHPILTPPGGAEWPGMGGMPGRWNLIGGHGVDLG